MTNNLTTITRSAGAVFAGLTFVAVGLVGAPGAAHASDDYDLWRTNFGSTSAATEDGGRISSSDLADWQSNYGTSASSSSDTSDAADYVVWRKHLG